MSNSEPRTFAVSDSGQFLGWVEDGDDINAAIATYETVVGPVSGEVVVIKNALLAETAPPLAEILFRGTEAGKPFVVYR